MPGTVLIGQTGPGVGSGNNNGAGFEFAQRLQCIASGTVDRLSIRTGPTNGPTAGNFHAALYADNAGGIDAAARLSGDITGNWVANSIVNFTVSPGVAVTAGTFYWIAWLSVGSSVDYTDFATTGGTERDTNGLSALANPHPTSASSNANVANVWAEGSAPSSAPGAQPPIFPTLPLMFVLPRMMMPIQTAIPPPPVLLAPTNVNLGIVDEVDTPQTLSRTKQRTLGLVTEADATQGITRVKQKVLGLLVETDAPQALTRAHARTLGLVTETDSPQPVGRVKSKTLGLVTETDTPQPLSISHGITSVNLGLVTETDTVQPIKRVKQRTFSLATETDQALNLTHFKQKTLSLLVETDTSQPITRQKRKATGLVTETETVLPISRVRSKTLGLITETDTAQHITVLTGIRRINLGLVTEVDTVRPLEPPLRIYPQRVPTKRYYIQRMGHSVRRRAG